MARAAALAEPTIDATYYATRNWALPTETPTPWPYIPPCRRDYCELIEGGEEYQQVLLDRVEVWRPWIQKYNGPNRWTPYGLVKSEIPVDLALAIMLKESRGKSSATGCAAEIGLFQIVPSDARSVNISPDCPTRLYGIPNFPGRPLASEMRQGHKNVQMALVILDDFFEEAELYLQERGQDPDGWLGEQGRVATAMFQCGHDGLRREICYSRGGFNYADDVISCWMDFTAGWPDPAATSTTTPSPTTAPSSSPTPEPSATRTPAIEVGPIASVARNTTEEAPMDLPALPIGTEELIASLISLVVMVAGPKFLSKLYDAVRLPGGAARVLATYAVSLAVGAAALLGVGAIAGTDPTLEGLMALAGILLAAASAAFQRLKDRGSIAGAP